MLIVVDFAQNYNHDHNFQLSEEHWSPWQSSILPCVVYSKDHLDKLVWAEDFCSISDDLKHDTSAVQHVLVDCINHYRVKLYSRSKIHITQAFLWSDGCSGQFKTCSQFAWLSSFRKFSARCGPNFRSSRVVEKINGDGSFKFFDIDAAVSACQMDLCHGMTENNFPGVSVEWNYFQSCHGKGPSDSENASLKGCVEKIKMNSCDLCIQ